MMIKVWSITTILILVFIGMIWLSYEKPWASGLNYIVTDDGKPTNCQFVKVKGKDYIRCYTAYGYHVIYPDWGEKER